MTTEEYLSKEELIEVLDWCCEQLGIEADLAEKSPIEKMLIFCKEFRTQLGYEILETEVTAEMLKNSYRKSQQSIYLAGTIFIFQLRSFLTQEDLLFNVGYWFTDDKAKTTRLASNFVNQKEIFSIKNIQGSITKEGFKIKEHLKNVESTKILSAEASNVIMQVLNYGNFTRYTKKPQEFVIKTNGHRHKAYHKNAPDTNVLVTFSGKNATENYYYNLVNRGTQINFNNGWLYEWASTYIANQGLRNLKNSMLKEPETPLSELMNTVAKRENIQGLQGGDYKGKINGQQRQIQAKLNNAKIISLNNIYTSIVNIEKALTAWGTVYKSRGFKKELSSKFAQTFTNEKLNNQCDNLINKKLKELFPNGQLS